MVNNPFMIVESFFDANTVEIQNVTPQNCCQITRNRHHSSEKKGKLQKTYHLIMGACNSCYSHTNMLIRNSSNKFFGFKYI